MTPRVSIITPSYSQAAFLEQTIRSVLGQGYPELEYLLVDGGSTDGSLEIIQKYAHQLTWWVSEPDKGQADAINKGFRRASGEVVAWLNSDDLYAPGAIAQAVKFLEDHPDVGMVYGNAVSFDQDGHPIKDLTFADWGLEGLVSFKMICQPAVFMRRAILEQSGYLDENYHLMLDHQLWLRIARLTRIKYIPELWAFARHHAGAKNVAQASRFGEEAFRVFEWMQTQPDLAEIIGRNRSTVMAMLHRFNGRYQLDGGLAWPALKSYLRAFMLNPEVALHEWHRIVFAGLSLCGLGQLGKLYYQIRSKKLPASIQALGIENINSIYAER